VRVGVSVVSRVPGDDADPGARATGARKGGVWKERVLDTDDQPVPLRAWRFHRYFPAWTRTPFGMVTEVPVIPPLDQTMFDEPYGY